MSQQHLTTLATRMSRHISAETGKPLSVAEALMNIEVIDRLHPLPYSHLLAMSDKSLAMFFVMASLYTMAVSDEEMGANIQ